MKQQSFSSQTHPCLGASYPQANLDLVCECLEWNWQNSINTFANVKFTQKTKLIFQPLGIFMIFQIIYCIFYSTSTSLFLFQMAFTYALFMSWINETSETSWNHYRASHQRESVKQSKRTSYLNASFFLLVFTLSSCY